MTGPSRKRSERWSARCARSLRTRRGSSRNATSVTREIAGVWHVCGTNPAEGASSDDGRVWRTCPDLGWSSGAGDRDRTGMTSLEGWGSTIELRPRGTCTVAYRLSHGAAAGPGRRDPSRLQPAEPIGLVRCSAGPLVRGPLVRCGAAARCRNAVGYGLPDGMWRSLVSAPALGAGGRRFESGHPDQKCRSQRLLRTAKWLPRSFDRHLTVVFNASQRQRPSRSGPCRQGVSAWRRLPLTDSGFFARSAWTRWTMTMLTGCWFQEGLRDS